MMLQFDFVCSYPDSTSELGWQQKLHLHIVALQLQWAVNQDTEKQPPLFRIMLLSKQMDVNEQ